MMSFNTCHRMQASPKNTSETRSKNRHINTCGKYVSDHQGLQTGQDVRAEREDVVQACQDGMAEHEDVVQAC